MKATWKDTVIAESDDTVVVEGNHYFPESSLKREYITFSKSFLDRKPNTNYAATARGKKAFRKHINAIENLLQ